jgi:hypothetical protein
MNIISRETNKAKESKPRISINKLAEYMEATSIRRRKIVYDAKYPQKYIVTRYKDAREAIKQFLLNGYGEDYVLNIINSLEEKVCETEFQIQDTALSIEALESFLDCDLSSISDYAFSPNKENELLKISDVNISVNPDLIITKVVNGKTNIGLIKLHLSKSNNLSEEGQKIVGALAYKYTQDFLNLNQENISNQKLCISLDIFKQGIDFCPTGYKMRLNRIEAACEEILLWWGKL